MTADAWQDDLLDAMRGRCEAIVEMKEDPEVGDVQERRTAVGALVSGLDGQTLAVEFGVDQDGGAFATLASYDEAGDRTLPNVFEWDRSIMVTTRVDPADKKE